MVLQTTTLPAFLMTLFLSPQGHSFLSLSWRHQFFRLFSGVWAGSGEFYCGFSEVLFHENIVRKEKEHAKRNSLALRLLGTLPT
jgi:hypothetical protein